MSDDELRRLLGDLAGEPPANPGRTQAVHARIAREGRRRATVRGLSAATAVVLVAVGGAGLGGLLDRIPSTPDRLGADPMSTALVSGTPTPGPSASPAPSPAAAPSATPSATSSPAPSIDGVRPALLLSTRFLEEAFGSGRAALAQNYDDKEPLLGSCLDGQAPLGVVRSTGRSWSWPDEVVVGETLVELASPEQAAALLDECADPTSRRYDPSAQPIADPVAVGEGGFLVQERHALFRQLHAGARVGRFLVVLQWRQSGRVPSAEPLVQALRAAVAKATSSASLGPVAAAAPQPDPALQGYLTRAGFPGGVSGLTDGARPYEWVRDQRAPETGISCGSTGAALTTAAPPVWRTWSAVAYDAVDPRTSLAVATAPEPAGAASDFARCRAAQDFTAEPVSDLGDEAYFLNTDTGSGQRELFVRSGATYLVLRATWSDRSTLEALARAAFTARPDE